MDGVTCKTCKYLKKSLDIIHMCQAPIPMCVYNDEVSFVGRIIRDLHCAVSCDCYTRIAIVNKDVIILDTYRDKLRSTIVKSVREAPWGFVYLINHIRSSIPGISVKSVKKMIRTLIMENEIEVTSDNKVIEKRTEWD